MKGQGVENRRENRRRNDEMSEPTNDELGEPTTEQGMCI
jgi:hypothetical protein